jgi:hypothetical protein
MSSNPGSLRTQLGVVALFAAGCSGAEVSGNRTPMFAILPPGATADGAADPEEFELCKLGSGGSFDYSVVMFGGPNRTNPGAPQNGSLTLDPGECVVLAAFGGNGADVTVTETSSQSGFALDHVDVTVVNNGSTSTTTVPGPSVTEFISGASGGSLRGALAEFFNEGEAGFQGCTPGYWKQSHHFDSWPAPYTPGTAFSAVFENAFPGKTLQQVLSQGGGGLKALGRHLVAALLNAASGDVNYNLSTGDVIGDFNAAFPGGDYEGLKGRLERFNEQGCPLN